MGARRIIFQWWANWGLGLGLPSPGGVHKLETVKMMSTSRKINAILLNIQINRPKLVLFCWMRLQARYRDVITLASRSPMRNIRRAHHVVRQGTIW